MPFPLRVDIDSLLPHQQNSYFALRVAMMDCGEDEAEHYMLRALCTVGMQQRVIEQIEPEHFFSSKRKIAFIKLTEYAKKKGKHGEKARLIMGALGIAPLVEAERESFCQKMATLEAAKASRDIAAFLRRACQVAVESPSTFWSELECLKRKNDK